MKVTVHAAASISLPQERTTPEVPRPAAIDALVWRRFSRLSRLAAAALAPVLEAPSADAAGKAADPERRRPLVDRDAIALYFGTGQGEYSSTFAFLRSLHQRGPAGASPLAFQNSVHNAAPGHLSIAFGLRGPSETLCAGDLTTLRTLERAMAAVTLTGEPALVVLADDLTEDAVAGWRYAGADWPLGEGASAFLLGPYVEPGLPVPSARPPTATSPPLIERRRPAGAPMTFELVDPGPGSPRHPTYRAPTDIRRSMDLDPFGACCTVEGQMLARAIQHRFRMDLGFPTAPGSAILVRLPA